MARARMSPVIPLEMCLTGSFQPDVRLYDGKKMLTVSMVERMIAVAALVAGLSTAPAFGQDSRYATTSLRLRADSTPNSTVLTTIPRAAVVSVSRCAGKWCSVAYKCQTGFAVEQYLSEIIPQSALRSSGDGYVNSAGDWVPSPRASRDPPAGATANVGTVHIASAGSGGGRALITEEWRGGFRVR